RTAGDHARRADRRGLEPVPRRRQLCPPESAQGLDWTLRTPRERALAVRAVLAWSELGKTGPGRLKPRANDECRLFLLDWSKTGRARWCSMTTHGSNAGFMSAPVGDAVRVDRVCRPLR